MAHIVVYLQRTPQGLHPASAVALCWARDIATERGATVTAVAHGDAGAFDHGILQAAGRFGADIVLFIGPHGMRHLHDRLHPVHVLVPWTAEGRAAGADLPSGPVIPRWIERPNPPFGGADAVTGVVAGTLPWSLHGEALEAEYEGDVDEATLPAWIEAASTEASREGPPTFRVAAEGDVGFGGTTTRLEDAVLSQLARRSAVHVSVDELLASRGGTFLWFEGTLPRVLEDRSPSVRIIALPGPHGAFDPSWSLADWVFGGTWSDALDRLLSGPWGTAHG